MTASLSGCKAKLLRAEHHMQEVEDKYTQFCAQNPTRITVERDTDRDNYVFRIWGVQEPDPAWGLIIGDAVHNARSALDHLAYQLLVVGLGRDPNDDEARRIMFPTCDNAADFQKRRTRSLQNLRTVDVARLEVLQPYNSWDETIWGPDQMPGPPAPISNYIAELSRLDNVDKHRLVQAVWFAAGLSKMPQNAQALGISGANTNGGPLIDGAEIGTWHFDHTPPEPPQEMQAHIADYFPTQISLREPLFGTRVGRILGNCVIAVKMVIDMFEPVILHGQDPAPLRYWDGNPPWL